MDSEKKPASANLRFIHLRLFSQRKQQTIMQAEAAECGLACLAMILAAHGGSTSLFELRRRFPLSLKGVKLSQLIHIAQQIGLRSRALRLDLDSLSQLHTPCILHWDLNHFVVLADFDGKKATILDPALGRLWLAPEEISRHFTGVALELQPEADFKRESPAPVVTVRQLVGRITELWPALMQILALSIALQFFVVLAPFFLQLVVDQALVSADRDLLIILGLGFGLALALQVAIGFARGWAIVYLSSRLGLQWMGNVFAHLLRLPLDFFEKRNLGDITSRLGSIHVIQRTLTTTFVESLIDGLMAVVTLAMMLFYNWKLAMVTLLAVSLYSGIRALAYRTVRLRTEQQLVANARQHTHLLESLRGIQSLKIACKESVRKSTYENLLVNTVNQDVVLARIGLGFSLSSQLVFGIERIAVIWIGALLAMENVFSVGMLIAYLAYKDQFATRAGNLIDKWTEFRMLRLHGERIADIVFTPPEEKTADTDQLLPTGRRLEVNDLSFRYAEGEPWVLKDCSFAIEPSESVAIVGPSGCGKTTLVKLLLGLLTPTQGSISIGGYNINKLGVRNYRSVVAAVMQDDQLFAGSISDNISFFDPEIDQAKVEEVAHLAAVHDEIHAMPMGYNSLIGDMGSSLSGGQKQRVILARALYCQPDILFLDEATSHLDVAGERLVSRALSQLSMTRIIVAHRPETIASAGRVLVISGAAVEEQRRF